MLVFPGGPEPEESIDANGKLYKNRGATHGMDTFVATELELLVVTALHLEALGWNPVGGWLVVVGGVEKIRPCCTGGVDGF